MLTNTSHLSGNVRVFLNASAIYIYIYEIKMTLSPLD